MKDVILSFEDDSCQSENGNDTLMISTPLDGCKTSITQEDNQIIFKNKIKAKADNCIYMYLTKLIRS